LIQDLIQDLIRDLITDLIPDLIRDLIRDLIPDLIPDLIRDLNQDLIIDLNPDLISNGFHISQQPDEIPLEHIRVDDESDTYQQELVEFRGYQTNASERYQLAPLR